MTMTMRGGAALVEPPSTRTFLLCDIYFCCIIIFPTAMKIDFVRCSQNSTLSHDLSDASNSVSNEFARQEFRARLLAARSMSPCIPNNMHPMKGCQHEFFSFPFFFYSAVRLCNLRVSLHLISNRIFETCRVQPQSQPRRRRSTMTQQKENR